MDAQGVDPSDFLSFNNRYTVHEVTSDMKLA